MKLTFIFLLTLTTLSCGYGSNYNGMGNAPGILPHITQVVPTSATAGGSGFVLTVNGTNFGSGTAIYWNSIAHNAAYLTGQQITTTISAAEVANPGDVEIYVRDHGQNSNTVMFSVHQ